MERRRRYAASLSAAGRFSVLCEADAGRDRLIDQRVERRHADDAEHRVLFVAIGPDVPVLERIGVGWLLGVDGGFGMRLCAHFVSSV